MVIASLSSGLIATIVTLLVTVIVQKRREKKDYKMMIFRELIANRADIVGGRPSSGRFQWAVNQVFVAFNDSPDVIKAFEDFRVLVTKTQRNNDISNELISKLILLLKAMAMDLRIDYSFSNDDLFTQPILIG